MTIRISILIRSRNDAGLIAGCMESLSRQQIDVPVEFVNVDNQSGDGTWELINQLNPDGVRFQWPDGAYIPGKVLNAAIARCSGSIVVFHNSDCIALDEHYLENLTRPLRDGTAQATFARQEPRANARPLIRKDYERAFGDGNVSSSWRHFFSLAAAAAPRELLLLEPFDESLRYSEDVAWSWRLRQHGGQILYIPTARVEHSHNYTLHETARRFFNEGVANHLIFGDRPTLMRGFLLPWGRETLRDWGWMLRRRNWRQLPYETLFRLVQRWNLYRGCRSGRWRA